MMNLNHKGWERPVFNGLRVVGVVSLLCVQSIFFGSEAGAQSMRDDSFEKTVEEARVPAFKWSAYSASKAFFLAVRRGRNRCVMTVLKKR